MPGINVQDIGWKAVSKTGVVAAGGAGAVAAGIEISTFALIEDYFYLGLMNFVDQMARIGHGLAIYCTAGELSGFVLDSFVKGRRTRRRLG